MTSNESSHSEPLENGALALACQKAQIYRDASRAESTHRTYAAAWRCFSAWCVAHRTAPLPALPEAVGAYLAALAGEGRSVATIKVALAAIAARHADAGQVLDRAHPALRSVYGGIARRCARPVRRARALGLEELDRIVATLQGSDIRSLRDRALLLVGFFAALRRSELVALDVAGRSSIEFVPEGLLIHVTGAKSSLETETVAVSRRGDALCPLTALRDYLAAAQITSGPVFRAVSRGGRLLDRRLDAASLRYILRRRAAAALAGDGERQRSALERLSPHSLRAGLITAAAEAGAPEHAIQASSRHRSAGVLRSYVRSAQAFRAGVGRHLEGGT